MRLSLILAGLMLAPAAHAGLTECTEAFEAFHRSTGKARAKAARSCVKSCGALPKTASWERICAAGARAARASWPGAAAAKPRAPSPACKVAHSTFAAAATGARKVTTAMLCLELCAPESGASAMADDCRKLLRSGIDEVDPSVVRPDGAEAAGARVEKFEVVKTKRCAEGAAPPPGFVCVDAGRFQMGSPASEVGRYEDETPHQVTLNWSIYVKATEVTRTEWKRLIGTTPSLNEGCGGTCPVGRLTWWSALEYANELSKKEGLDTCYVFEGCNDKRPGDGFVCGSVRWDRGPACPGYRLPTEAEWEYVARAGTQTATWAGDLQVLGPNHAPVLDAIAWYGGNSKATYEGAIDCSGWKGKQHPADTCGPQPVAGRGTNPWGVADMLGNATEWVWDAYAEYGDDAVDPLGPSKGKGRVIRGGSWGMGARDLRAAYRGARPEHARDPFVGFRLVRTVK